MHHALEIQEILFHIFDHCYPHGRPTPYHRRRATRDLAALARTCRAFKEPALDVLWGILVDLSPLARCLPDISRLSSVEESLSMPVFHFTPGQYLFTRPLTQVECDTLQSYTRRIRTIHRFGSGLCSASIDTLSRLPTTGPLFPNLRVLHCEYQIEIMPLLHLPFPSLVDVEVDFDAPSLFRIFSRTFPMSSPNVRTFSIRMRRFIPTPTELNIEGSSIFCWKNLRSMDCPQVALNADALEHMSHLPTLTRLSFRLGDTFPAPGSHLSFPNLRILELYSERLNPISCFISQIPPSAITDFAASISKRPSKQEISSFFAGVQASGAGHAIQKLQFSQSFTSAIDRVGSGTALLDLDDLRPCMAFRNLSHMDFKISCHVYLTENDILALASALPHLQHFQINADWGWGTVSGITPGGLVQLLQTCPSLTQIALLDVRGYTESPPSHAPATLGIALPPTLSINVLDSVIEPESLPAVTTFFSAIVACSDLTLPAGKHQHFSANKYKIHWENIICLISSGLDDLDLNDFFELK